jgi:hypothetical protein
MSAIPRISSNVLKPTTPAVQNTHVMIDHGNWLCFWDLQISSKQLRLKNISSRDLDQHLPKDDCGKFIRATGSTT